MAHAMTRDGTSDPATDGGLRTAAETKAILQGFEAAGADRGVYYLSTPITTGRREFELMDRLGCVSRAALRSQHGDQWRSDVVGANERDARLHADVIAETVALGLLVVNPARITLGHWEQDHYDDLWERLIRTFPVRVVAAPGWEFSRGCRVEVQLAIELGIDVIDVGGRSLNPRDLARLATTADDEIMDRGWLFGADPLPAIRGTSADPGHEVELPSEPDAGFARQVFVWLAHERDYQLKKFGVQQDDAHTREHGVSPDGWWTQQLDNYYHRARVLGLEHPNGRQALAKFVATACGLLESVVRLYGSLPVPGVPSGQLDGVEPRR